MNRRTGRTGCQGGIGIMNRVIADKDLRAGTGINLEIIEQAIDGVKSYGIGLVGRRAAISGRIYL